MLDKHNQSSPRVIENRDCLKQMMWKNRPVRIVGKQFGIAHESIATPRCYYDIMTFDGRRYHGIHESQLAECEVVEPEPVCAVVAQNGHAKGW